MLKVESNGFDDLLRELDEAQRALNSLDGTIATLQFNPSEPDSVQDAIRQVEDAVDSKTASYRGNALVSKLAEGLKDTFREQILERANAEKQ